MKNWMKKLALHYQRTRELYPEDKLMILFDIDGTILDARHIVLEILGSYDRAHQTDFFGHLDGADIHVHEDQIEPLLEQLSVPHDVKQDVLNWYSGQRWAGSAALEAHRPFRGVMEVIRWFQIQPDTYVGLNTGKPESVRHDTLRYLNEIGREYKVFFDNDLLHMNRYGWDTEVEKVKVEGVRHFQNQGYRIFAFVDNDPKNLQAVGRIDHQQEILLLYASTIRESRRLRLPSRSITGEKYDITELVHEKALPGHIHFVWHGVNDEANLRQFLASNVQWAEFDVRTDPTGDLLILRHDSFMESPVHEEEEFLQLSDTLESIQRMGKSVKLDLKEGGALLDRILALLQTRSFDASHLWFNANVQTLGKEGFEQLGRAYPRAVLQCPVDFLVPLVLASPDKAEDLLATLRDWGLNRFSVSWKTPDLRQFLDRMDEWGYEMNIYNLPDLESFLRAVLLLPKSITSDFNFPQWHYFGRGSGQNQNRYEYVMKSSE